jgi:hypothetical protein
MHFLKVVIFLGSKADMSFLKLSNEIGVKWFILLNE